MRKGIDTITIVTICISAVYNFEKKNYFRMHAVIDCVGWGGGPYYASVYLVFERFTEKHQLFLDMFLRNLYRYID